MSKDGINIAALGQAMDATFGRSSASYGPVVQTRSVKASLVGADLIKVVYTTIVNLVRDRQLVEVRAMYEKEADSAIETAVKRIAEDYKEQTEESVKLKRKDVVTELEIVDLNAFNSKRTALFRRIATFQAS